MGFGGGGSDTTEVVPWENQRFALQNVWNQAGKLFEGYRPEYYGGTTVAPFTQPQLASQQYLQDYAQSVQPLIGAGQNTAGFLAGGGAMDVANNPYIQGAGQAMTSQISQNLMSDILPQIRSMYRPGQSFGGSRENLAVGRAVEGATGQMGDALRQLYGGAYGQGLQATQGALQNLPQMAQLGAYPAQLLQDVGGQQRQYEQARIDADRARHDYYRDLPYQQLDRYQAPITGQMFGTETTAPGQQSNPFSAALGGAAAGQAILPGWGAAIGGGLGLLGSLF